MLAFSLIALSMRFKVLFSSEYVRLLSLKIEIGVNKNSIAFLFFYFVCLCVRIVVFMFSAFPFKGIFRFFLFINSPHFFVSF